MIRDLGANNRRRVATGVRLKLSVSVGQLKKEEKQDSGSGALSHGNLPTCRGSMLRRQVEMLRLIHNRKLGEVPSSEVERHAYTIRVDAYTPTIFYTLAVDLLFDSDTTPLARVSMCIDVSLKDPMWYKASSHVAINEMVEFLSTLTLATTPPTHRGKFSMTSEASEVWKVVRRDRYRGYAAETGWAISRGGSDDHSATLEFVRDLANNVNVDTDGMWDMIGPIRQLRRTSETQKVPTSSAPRVRHCIIATWFTQSNVFAV
ncbi:hypothetical protein BJY52DRAFT_1220463 [Lactarius psammicola]|nr:hypothetical protein BJY52DRAFT_1220463 [Lactarius psammicola]